MICFSVHLSFQSATYNCNNALCATIYCVIDNLRMGEGAVVQIQARFFEKTLADVRIFIILSFLN